MEIQEANVGRVYHAWVTEQITCLTTNDTNEHESIFCRQAIRVIRAIRGREILVVVLTANEHESIFYFRVIRAIRGREILVVVLTANEHE